MRCIKWTAVVVIAMHLLLRGDLLLPVAVWDGRFPLTVHVSSTAEDVRSITCSVFQSREIADYAVENPSEREFWSFRAVTIEAFDGKPFDIDVPVSGKSSLLGRDISRMQFQYLAVKAELKDGRRVAKVVEIPDGRRMRYLFLKLP